MDIARPELKLKRRRRRIIYGVSSLIALAVITMGLQRLQPAAPTVENAYLGTVERGPMLRQVRGNGTLVPEEKKFPPRSLLMGRPAVLRRELTDAEVATIRDYSQRYVGYRKDYIG